MLHMLAFINFGHPGLLCVIWIWQKHCWWKNLIASKIMILCWIIIWIDEWKYIRNNFTPLFSPSKVFSLFYGTFSYIFSIYCLGEIIISIGSGKM